MSRVQRCGAIGSSAAFGVAVVAPWMAKWPYLGIVVLALLAVSVWALLTMRRTMKHVEPRGASTEPARRDRDDRPRPAGTRRGGDLMELTCALCLHQKDRKLHNAAVTVLEGYAVCEPHLPFLSAAVADGTRWSGILAALNAPWEAWQAREASRT